MISRKTHKIVGLVMLVPMIGWICTGIVFFIKPGYAGAYEALHLKTYPLDSKIAISIDEQWDELRVVRSILGNHLLVKSGGESRHLNAASLEENPLPDEAQLKTLFEDAISHNQDRYGSVSKVDNTTAYTSTGITLALDWNELRFTQKGFDRKVIGILYKIHYLQWTPWPLANQILGIAGLLLLFLLAVFGLRIYIVSR